MNSISDLIAKAKNLDTAQSDLANAPAYRFANITSGIGAGDTPIGLVLRLVVQAPQSLHMPDADVNKYFILAVQEHASSIIESMRRMVKEDAVQTATNAEEAVAGFQAELAAIKGAGQ